MEEFYTFKFRVIISKDEFFEGIYGTIGECELQAEIRLYSFLKDGFGPKEFEIERCPLLKGVDCV
jgi:hypothetical protein